MGRYYVKEKTEKTGGIEGIPEGSQPRGRELNTGAVVAEAHG